MDVRLLEIKENLKLSYDPAVHFESWRIAFLNTAERFDVRNIKQMERHLLTDESFVLLEGTAVLFIGDGNRDTIGNINAVWMERDKVYNVRQGVWHAIATGENTLVLVIENDNTSNDNSPKKAVDPVRLLTLMKAAYLSQN